MKNKDISMVEAYDAIVKGLGILNGFDNGNRDKPKKEKKKPKKEKKPITSVIVVTTTLPAIAGSWLNFRKIIGINIPAIAELIKLTIIAALINIEIIISLNQR